MLILLAGCAAVPVVDPSGAATAGSGATAIAGVGDEIVLLNCGIYVPLDAAAGVLGLPAAAVVDQQDPPVTVTAYPGAVAEAMAAPALRMAGEQHCRYVGSALEERGPEVRVSVLPNGASEFGLVEPDVNDGLRNMLPAALGDEGYSACRDGEWQGCRAEVLIGSSWISISVASPDLDPDAFLAYAGGVVDSLGTLKFEQKAPSSRPECGALLSPHDLNETGALVDATGGDLLVLDDRKSQHVAAWVHGGLVSCAWSGESVASGVALTILPGAGGLWAATPPAAIPSTVPMQSVDLSGQSAAQWPSAGVEALAGCGDDQCQVTLMADGTWLTVTAPVAAGLSGVSALAAAAYQRYAEAT
ncbi:hypothetical protein [Cryobacterium sp. PAMC25264]|uniref:hypothetical protein n=1 Tax=Cryobacterium sp. PAMC25264 TaxID=2861288 RepID=UPI001C6354BB|nr:hypothetical protein [Cryobacterium sp. PAMC25264]QYF72244.1 hypothetical protein KY500_10275 [Cryobacterium sp. PAMC25264]